MIINNEIKELVARIDEASRPDRHLIAKFVNATNESCARHRVLDSGDSHFNAGFAPYPTDAEGYAVSYDPITQEEAFRETWRTHGIVVGRGIATPAQCEHVLTRIQDIFNALSGGAFDPHDPTTYSALPSDMRGKPILSRGFMEVYHDDSMAQIRQSVRNYLHHVLIWEDAKIWTSFDRLGVKLPSAHNDGGKGLPLHVDQNPKYDPQFKTVQGVLALDDCPLARGTFRGVPGSRSVFNQYASIKGGKREFVELSPQHPHADKLAAAAQAFPLRRGDLVSWDSRTTHANTDNVSADPRYVFYIAAGLAAENNHKAVSARMDAYARGAGTSMFKTPEALLRATIKPRFEWDENQYRRIRQPEDLNYLGRLIYGMSKYKVALG